MPQTDFSSLLPVPQLGEHVDPQKLGGVLDAIGAGLAVVNREGRITWSNHTLHHEFGSEAATGAHHCIRHVPPLETGCRDCPVRHTYATGKQSRQLHARTLPDGRKRWYQVVVSPLLDAKGHVDSVLELRLDVTRLVTAENELRHANARLSEQNTQLRESRSKLERIVHEHSSALHAAQAKLLHSDRIATIGLFASGIAHEVGNPLASISSVLQLLQHERPGDPRLKILDEQIARIGRILQEIKAFTRGSSSSALKLLDVHKVIQDTVTFSRYYRKLFGKQIEIRCRTPLPPGAATADGLQQVILNLVMNAADALPAEHGRIGIEAYGEDERVVIRVSDNGSGIPETIRHKLFEAFVTTKPAGTGTGLGLFISKQLVEQWGGVIAIESSPDTGTIVTVRLRSSLPPPEDQP